MCSLYKVDKEDKHGVNNVRSFENLMAERIKSIEKVIEEHFRLYRDMIISLRSANKQKEDVFNEKLEDELLV